MVVKGINVLQIVEIIMDWW